MYFQNRLILESLEKVLSTASVGVHYGKDFSALSNGVKLQVKFVEVRMLGIETDIQIVISPMTRRQNSANLRNQ